MNNCQVQTVRMAVLTMGISHFEVPLFRLCTQCKGLHIKVFYVHPVKDKKFDSEYDQEIEWGCNLLAGYDSLQVKSPRELIRAAHEWGCDLVMIYGYGWPGAPQIILRNWLKGQAQIHRGTLNYFPDPRRTIKRRLLNPLGRLLLRLFDAHHYGGDYSRKVLLGAGVKEDSLFFVPYSVDTRHFLVTSESPVQLNTALAIRKDQGWSLDDHVILFIAHHNWVKGPDIAMEVFRRVSMNDTKARFLIVGAGRMTADMKDYSRKYFGHKITHFVGFVPSSQTIAYYLASDLVICSSRYETWARMVNEAMLCRRPCIVSRTVAAAGGLVDDGVNGHVVHTPEVSQFVIAIQSHFALSPHERQQMGEAAREKAKLFAYEPYIDNVLAAARYAIRRAGRDKSKAGAE